MSFKKNIIANFAGSVWGALISLASVPFYIFFLGVEAYGLIGFFATLQILFSILEMGLGAANQREFAKYRGGQSDKENLSNLVRVLAVIYWVTALVVGILIVLLAPWLARNWLNIKQLSLHDTHLTIVLMGLSFAIRWPSLLYSGGLMGMQKQVPLNWIKAATDAMRGVGSVLILWLISSTITAFFSWQIIVELVNTLVLRGALRKYFPQCKGVKDIQFKQLRRVWKFAAGMGGISILVVILMQLDKVILSRLLTLESFGYYTIAGSLSLGLTLLIRPIFSATYPKLTQLVELKDEEQIKRIYHDSCQLMSVLIVPLALVVSFFSKEVLYLWTNNLAVAEHAHSVLSILIIGTALNGIMNVPYALQLAHGWTRLTFYMNLVAVAILAPLIIVMTNHYGAEGAALVWVLLNGGYVFIGIHLMHHRLLPSEKWEWYLKDMALPVLGAFFVVWPARMLFGENMSEINVAISLVGVLFAAYFFSAMMSSSIRRHLLTYWKQTF